MCIRDRLHLHHLADVAGSADARGFDRLPRGCGPPRDRRVPVSFTHLRAHETVLDIVCRLLLEKKNNGCPVTILI